MNLKEHIRTISDFPKPGIEFRDITTLLLNGKALDYAVARLSEIPGQFDIVAGIEARGFIFGAAVARELGVGFLPLRKPGKLPGRTLSENYDLEYGSDALHMPDGVVEAGKSVLLIDDLIATGGTAIAAVSLLRRARFSVAAAAFVIDLPDLMGASRLRALDVPVTTLVEFPGH